MVIFALWLQHPNIVFDLSIRNSYRTHAWEGGCCIRLASATPNGHNNNQTTFFFFSHYHIFVFLLNEWVTFRRPDLIEIVRLESSLYTVLLNLREETVFDLRSGRKGICGILLLP